MIAESLLLYVFIVLFALLTACCEELFYFCIRAL